MRNFSKEYEEKEKGLNLSLEKSAKLLNKILRNQKNVEVSYSNVIEYYEIILKNYESLSKIVIVLEGVHKKSLNN